MKLHFRTLGEGVPLIILHGVFGSSDNWQTVGKLLSDYFKVYLVDQRNHGRSPHSDAFNYELMSSDLLELMDEENINSCYLMGHSMGGKTAMNFVGQHPEKVDKLIVADIAPKQYAPHHQQIFAAFHSLDLTELKSRGEADEKMSAVMSDVGVRMFLLKNLSRNAENQFVWKLNLESIENNVDEIGKGLDANLRFDQPTLFIKGGQSGYISDDDYRDINQHFPSSRVETIVAAGHWVHAQEPQALFELVLDFLMKKDGKG
jgi:pimeloyl-ACP methyl ester carboxylesterase